MRRTATAALAFALVALAGCSGTDPGADEPDGSPTTGTTGATPSAETSEPASEPPTTTEPSSGSADTVVVPVFFVGDTPQGPRLFRELREVETDNPLEEAAALLTAGDALDPDYRTLFPGGSFESVAYVDGELHAVVGDDGWNTPVDQTRREARLAVQSLVYTLQGVQRERARLKVFVRKGTAPGLLFGIDTSAGVTNAPPLKVLGLVNVTSPEEGATVSGSFTAEGVASSFEATVPWEIRRGDEVVERGFTTADGWLDRLYPWRAEIDVSGLEPGEYSFVALTDDPSVGEGGGPHADSKSIIVE